MRVEVTATCRLPGPGSLPDPERRKTSHSAVSLTDACVQQAKPTLRLSRLCSSDYGGNILRYNQSLLIISPVTECCHLAIGD